MEDPNRQEGLVIEAIPSGRNGTMTLTARLNGESIHVDELNVKKDAARQKFLDAFCNSRPGIDRVDAAVQLTKLAADIAKQPEEPSVADNGSLPEIDVSFIVRPERFVMREVSGLAVPTMTTVADKPVGRWRLYLRWTDGMRECRPLPSMLELSDGRRLWIHPAPAEPTASMACGWSSTARRAWLAGEPAPSPADVFMRVCGRIAHFLDLPAQHAPGITATLALWAMMTYLYHVLDAVPYLFIGGPLGSGKSTVFAILHRLVFRPLGSSNLTAPALFRTLHNQGGTLLLDEAERLKNTQSPEVGEMLSMLLAGYKRGGQAMRLEPVGDGFKTVCFDVFGPKAMACIAGLPQALASRSVSITMFRAAPGSDKPRRRIDADPAAWERLRDDLHTLALEYGSTWLDLPKRTEVCPAMSGRDFELWQPLLALAAWVESHGASGLLGLMQRYALDTIDVSKDDQVADADETLLRILTEKRANLETPQPKDILEEAQKTEPTVFKLWTAKGVSNALKRYGVVTTHLHGNKVYRPSMADLGRIQTTYGLTLRVPTVEHPPSGPGG